MTTPSKCVVVADATLIENGVKKIVCLSTDKAAYPINAMGMTKALMERVFVARSRTAKDTLICGTRYGNVMCSRGSVIPLFIDQIKKGQAITLTDPLVTRFIMSLDEAIDLIIFALENASAGDIFVQKSCACTIGDLAEALKKVFNVNNEIVQIGLRHGEKSHETLLTKEEAVNAEDIGNYFRIPADVRDLNYTKYFTEGSHNVGIVEEYSSNIASRLDVKKIVDKLISLEYIRNELNSWKNKKI